MNFSHGLLIQTPVERRVDAAALLRLHGVGPRAIRLLREALAAQSLAFAERDR